MAHVAFQFLKYSIYWLLTYNAFLFFIEDHTSSSRLFLKGMGWSNFIESYSSSIDTTAWLVLLFIFEIETYVLSERLLKGLLKFALNSIKAISYLFVIYAFYGYLMKYNLVHDYTIFHQDPCGLLGEGYTYIVSLSDYQPITEQHCFALSSSVLYQINGTQIIGTESAIGSAHRQALVNIINSADWLLIVLILEVDALLKRRMRLIVFIKSVLYAVLFINAFYWFIEGTLLDFWDAFLWLFAFIFIEMNIGFFKDSKGV